MACWRLTWGNKAVLGFFFDIKCLLFVVGLVLVTASTRWSALRCDRSVDAVCRQMTLLKQQVHHLREIIDSLRVSRLLGGNLTAVSGLLVLSVIPHLPRVSESVYCLLMSGSLQTFSINGNHAIT